MSEFCRKTRRSPDRRSAGGFTLLEMLVVLVLVGLMAAVAFPQFTVIQDRLTYNLNRDTFEQELTGLGYVAFKEGRPLILAGVYPRTAEQERLQAEEMADKEKEPQFLKEGELRPLRPSFSAPAQLKLPEDWRVKIDSPVVYQASGFCSGGSLTVTIGDARYAYDLKAPTCQAQLRN